MIKTLVIILAETREHELTFDNIKKNLIDELNADLCLCIGVKDDYDYNNPFYTFAKHKFLYKEPTNYLSAFQFAENIINPNLKINWHKFMQLKDQFLGGVLVDPSIDHLGSAGILIFYRWFLLHKLNETNLINQYDRFIITRSDYIYLLPHPKMEILNENNIWMPNGEHYGGLTNRHVVLNKTFLEPYLNILNCFILKNDEYFNKMKKYEKWNLEQLIGFHLYNNNNLKNVKFFPYIMYTVRSRNGTTRWQKGVYDEKHKYFIKYITEHEQANLFKKKFEENKKDIDLFYHHEMLNQIFSSKIIF